MQLSKNFTLAELTVTNTGLPNKPNAAQINSLRALCEHILQPIRDRLGRPIKVTSAYRAPAVNRAVGGSATSDHMNGNSADIVTAGMDSRKFAEFVIAMNLPFDQLIQYPGSARIHVSYRATPRREVKHAVRRNDKTVYVPGLK